MILESDDIIKTFAWVRQFKLLLEAFFTDYFLNQFLRLSSSLRNGPFLCFRDVQDLPINLTIWRTNVVKSSLSHISNWVYPWNLKPNWIYCSSGFLCVNTIYCVLWQLWFWEWTADDCAPTVLLSFYHCGSLHRSSLFPLFTNDI